MDAEEAACQPRKMWGGLRFWGVVVKPGEPVNIDPGELYYHLSQIALEAEEKTETNVELKNDEAKERVEGKEDEEEKENGEGKENEQPQPKENVNIFIKIDDESIMLGTLSVDKDHHFTTNLVLKKKFELMHSSMTSDIYFTGYKFHIMDPGDDKDKTDAQNSSDVVDSESFEDVVYYPQKDKTDVHNPSAGDDSESSEDVDSPRKKAKGEKRPLETPTRTPQGKEAKIGTPTTGNKTGYVHIATPHPAKQAPKTSDHVHVATPHPAKQAPKTSDHVHVATPHPAKQAPKTSDHVHVATPHPAKQAPKTSDHVHVATPHPAKRARTTPKSNDESTQTTGHICGLCNRTFSSPMGLRDHSKAKHGAT